ncbi:MAG: glycoside hydrolase family 3 C-terminal domain-containing protein [Oscillospiraceae bacterium]|nr:glycoside hydrolase family 3 C-terminal domain-containing protein [Oscillospiraceae bacterium]
MDREKARAKAAALVARMTLEEKASQLRYDAPAIERLGIPAYNWWNEALHGVARGGTATSFPQAIALAATFDDGLVEALGDAAATEGRAKYNALSARGDRDIYHGLTFWSPNINIFRDPRWGRGHETYGEDPYLTSRMGQAYVRGLQGSGETLKAAACAKHFAVHSGPEALRHSFEAVASPKDMEETYLPAFRDLVTKAKVEAVMGAYNSTNGEPCCGSVTLLRDILRDAWGFAGHVVSDCWAVRDFHTGHMVTRTPQESAAMALSAGCDLNCGCTFLFIVRAVQEGLVSEDAVTEAAVRLFTTRYLLGIMGEGSEYDAIPYDAVECPEHLALAREAALKSCVLLKNNGLLPLNAGRIGTVGVIGPNADSRDSLVGNYHGTSSRYITLLEAVEDVMEGRGRVLYSEGCHLTRDRVEPLAQPDDRLAEAEAVAAASDLVILALGFDEHYEGEEPDDSNAGDAGDKPDLLLPEPQRRLLTAVLDAGKPTVVVLLGGSAMDVSEAQERADAVLLAWYPGARGGKAVAELLFGAASPSGKLPVTFYRNEALRELPDFTDYSMRNRTYKYYTGTPLYPFGYGLSYADMALRGLCADGKTARVTVRNDSGFAAEEVVELWLRDEDSADAPPHPILAGFARVRLEPGEEREVCVPLDEAAFTVVGDDGVRRPGSGRWTVYAGFGQPDARTEALTGRKCLSTALTL